MIVLSASRARSLDESQQDPNDAGLTNHFSHRLLLQRRPNVAAEKVCARRVSRTLRSSQLTMSPR